MTVNVQKRHRYRIAGIRSKPVPVTPRQPTESRRLYTLLTMITAAGVFAGAYSFSAYGGEGLADIIAERGSVGFVKAFSDSLLLTAAYILICFFGGFSSVGKSAAYLLCIFKGMGAGYLSACLFSQGIAGENTIAALDILPFEAMSIAVVIFAARENIRMSDLTAKRTFGDTSEGQVDMGLYLKKFAVIAAAAAIASALDGLISMASQLI